MSNGGERRLKLVKTSPPTELAEPSRQPVRRRRPHPRRTVTRRIPGRDPVSAVLERLDEEPVDLTDRPRAFEEPGDRSRPDETADDPGPVRSAERQRPEVAGPGVTRRRGVTVGLAILLCAALAVAGFFGNRWYQDRALAEAHGQAVAAARQTTVNFVSVSASSVDGDLQRIVAGATGEFKEEFLRGQAQVRAAVIENKVESTGSVLRAGLVSGDRRTAVVLVAVDATVKNTHAPDGRVAHYRIQVELARNRNSDTWLVSRLQFVG